MKTSENTVNYYNNRAAALTHRYESVCVEKLQLKLKTALEGCTSVLELGCGSGRDAVFLLENSPGIAKMKVTDASHTMLKEATVQHPELAPLIERLQLPEDLNLETVQYQGIYSIAALMHLEPTGITETLRQIHRILLPGGVFFVSVCTSREIQPAKDTRTFTLKDKKWWLQQIAEAALTATNTEETSDGFGRRETHWLNITALKSK